MKHEAINVAIILIAVMALVSCATKTSNLQINEGFKNYALSTNGAKITLVSHSGLTPNSQHPIETLINGNHSSDDWTKGEGWECSYTSRININGGQTRLGSESASITDIVVEFPQEIQISRVTVFTIDNKEYPAMSYGVSDLGVRYPVGMNAWAPVELEGIKTKYPARIQDNKKGIINFRFKPIKTKAIKLFICDTNDSADKSRDRYTRDKEGIIRLIEIEAYGTEKVNL
jgi:hypothetical protein